MPSVKQRKPPKPTGRGRHDYEPNPDDVLETTRECRGCDAPMHEADILKADGNYGHMLLDPAPNPDGTWVRCEDRPAVGDEHDGKFTHAGLELDHAGPRYQTHWATCPKAAEFRRNGEKP